MEKELCEVRNNMDYCNKCGFCSKGDKEVISTIRNDNIKRVQLWQSMKEYFQKDGVVECKSEKGKSYEEMYDKEYCDWLSHIYGCMFGEYHYLSDCFEFDEICDKIHDMQYKIESKLKEDFNKLGEL